VFDDILDTLINDLQEALMDQSAQEALNFRSPICNASVTRAIERAVAHAESKRDERLEAMSRDN
jgi:hypothetical protein